MTPRLRRQVSSLALVAGIALPNIGADSDRRMAAACDSGQRTAGAVLSVEIPDGWVSRPTPPEAEGVCLALVLSGKTEKTSDKSILVQFQKRGQPNGVTTAREYARAYATMLMAGHPDVVPRAWTPVLKLKVSAVAVELMDGAAKKAPDSTSHRLLVLEVTDGWYAIDVSVSDPADLTLPLFELFFSSLRVN